MIVLDGKELRRRQRAYFESYLDKGEQVLVYVKKVAYLIELLPITEDEVGNMSERIISTRDFNEWQRKYYDILDKEKRLILRKKKKYYTIEPITEQFKIVRL